MEEGNYTATPKIDGAGAIATIKANGVDVYSIRRDKDGKLIRYTDHIGGLRNLQIPKELEGRSFRGEVFAERDGRVLPPREISGLLNSTLSNTLRKKMRENITMRMAALAELEDGGEQYSPERMTGAYQASEHTLHRHSAHLQRSHHAQEADSVDGEGQTSAHQRGCRHLQLQRASPSSRSWSTKRMWSYGTSSLRTVRIHGREGLITACQAPTR